jgi:hypothetical protein
MLTRLMILAVIAILSITGAVWAQAAPGDADGGKATDGTKDGGVSSSLFNVLFGDEEEEAQATPVEPKAPATTTGTGESKSEKSVGVMPTGESEKPGLTFTTIGGTKGDSEPAVEPEKPGDSADMPRSDGLDKLDEPHNVTPPIALPDLEAITTEPKATVEPKAATEPKATVEPKAATEPKATVEPKAATEPKATVEPKAATEPKATVEPKAATEPAAAGPKDASEPEVASEPPSRKSPFRIEKPAMDPAKAVPSVDDPPVKPEDAAEPADQDVTPPATEKVSAPPEKGEDVTTPATEKAAAPPEAAKSAGKALTSEELQALLRAEPPVATGVLEENLALLEQKPGSEEDVFLLVRVLSKRDPKYHLRLGAFFDPTDKRPKGSVAPNVKYAYDEYKASGQPEAQASIDRLAEWARSSVAAGADGLDEFNAVYKK